MIKRLLALLLAAALLTPVFALAAQEGVKYEVTADYANVLPSPDAFNLPLASLPKGAVVRVTAEENGFGFIKIASNGVSGWVYMGVLRFIGAPEENTDGVSGIYVKSLPEKRTYVAGEETFNPAGLSVFAAYEDGREDTEITQGLRVYAPSFAEPGEKTALVCWTAPGGAVFTAEFTLFVSKVPLQSMTVETPPEKTEYIEGQALDLTGLSVRLTYSDGRPDRVCGLTELLSDADFIFTGCHSETQGKILPYGTHNIHIYYKYTDISCTVRVTAAQKKLISFTVDIPPDSLVTYTNEALPPLAGLRLLAEYDSGEKKYVYASDCDIVCDPASFVPGPGNRITLRYGEKSVTLEYTYLIDEPTGIKVHLPGKHMYILGETIDLSELAVYEVWRSGKETPLDTYAIGAIDPEKIGPQEIPVTHGDASDVLRIDIDNHFQKGDVDGNGEVEPGDARRALRASLGLIPNIANLPFEAADADRSGALTPGDARLILRASLGLESLLDFTNIVIYPDYIQEDAA